MVGDGAAVLVARVFDAARRPEPPDALSRFRAIYNDRLLKFTRAYPGIPEALDALQNRARLAVLTNKPLEATREVLSGLDLARYFLELVLGGDRPAAQTDPAGLLWLMGKTAEGGPRQWSAIRSSVGERRVPPDRSVLTRPALVSKVSSRPARAATASSITRQLVELFPNIPEF